MLRAVFFYNGKNFCLRGGQEHRNLKFSQITRDVVPVNGQPRVSYVYKENGSKNRSGGLKQLRLDNKIVRQFESVDAGDRCHVTILDTYYLKVPKEALTKNAFYLRPLPNVPSDPCKPWFSSVPVGRNTLSNMMKEMAKEAGLPNQYTNHSLRAYGTTEMFRKGVPEAIIKQRTGHRSLEGLRKYERVTKEQEMAVSNILDGANVPMSINSIEQPGPSTSSTKFTTPELNPISLAGCHFSGCNITFNINPHFTQQTHSTVNQRDPLPVIEDYTDIDIKELLDF